MKRIKGLLIGACMALCLTACADKGGIDEKAQEEDTAKTDSPDKNALEEKIPAWRMYADEKITLDWYINYSWYTTKWGGNVVSDAITEETGVSINFITPMGNESEKLNSLIVSDTLPDLITLGYWEPQVKEIISKDMAYALNELADEYDAYFWEVTDETVVNWYTQEDGNIYAYPNSAISPQDCEENDKVGSNETFLVRKDIYEAIGSPDMSTPEGFEQAVKDAVSYCPEVNGRPIIPIGAHVFDNEGNVSFDKYLMNFLAVPWEKDGKIYDRRTDAEYIKWLKLFRKMGQEGYLANDIFVDTRIQMGEKLAQGQYFCMIYQYTDMLAEQRQLYAADPESIYIAVEGPGNSDGSDPELSTTGLNGWTVTLISKKCEEPERAIAFMDYLLSEHGQMMIYLGVEGVTYEMENGRPVLIQEVADLLGTDREQYDSLYGADDAYWMLQNNIMQLQWKQEAHESVAQLEEWSRKYKVYTGQYDIDFLLEPEAASAEEKITRLWSRTLPELLLAPTEEEFDVRLQEFVEERERLGYREVAEAQSILMNEAKKKLGL